MVVPWYFAKCLQNTHNTACSFHSLFRILPFRILQNTDTPNHLSRKHPLILTHPFIRWQQRWQYFVCCRDCPQLLWRSPEIAHRCRQEHPKSHIATKTAFNLSERHSATAINHCHCADHCQLERSPKINQSINQVNVSGAIIQMTFILAPHYQNFSYFGISFDNYLTPLCCLPLLIIYRHSLSLIVHV